MFCCLCGLGSIVGIATAYGLDGPGMESRSGEIFCTCPEGPWDPPSLLYNGYRVFSGVKSSRGLKLTPHTLPLAQSRKSRAVPLLHLWYLQRVQSLGACRMVHFTLPLPVVCHRLKLDGQTQYLNVKLSVMSCKNWECKPTNPAVAPQGLLHLSASEISMRSWT